MKIHDKQAFRHRITLFKYKNLLSYWSFLGLTWYDYEEHVNDLRYVCEMLGFLKPSSPTWWLSRISVAAFCGLWSGVCIGIGGTVIAHYHQTSFSYNLELALTITLFGLGIIIFLLLFKGVEYMEYMKLWKYRDSEIKKEV